MASYSSNNPGNSTAYINGRIYTIDTSHPWASGFIVSPDGNFGKVGTTDAIRAIAHNSGLVVVDLKGQFVMPGIHDAHMHLLMSALALTSDVSIAMDSTSDNIAQRVKDGNCACHFAHAYGNWIQAAFYDNRGFPNMQADRRYLDAAFPDEPLMIVGGAQHSVLLNTVALEQAGYDIQNEPDAPGSKFFRRDDGSLTGELAESAMTKARLAMPKPSLAHVKRVLKHAIKIAHRAGVTSCQEASANTLEMHALKELEEEGQLNMDIATHLVYAPEWVAGEKQETSKQLLDSAEAFNSKHIETRFVKIILDGVPLPPLFTHCALDSHGDPDLSKLLVQDVKEAIVEYDGRGMTVKVHCAGQGATRLALDAIEAARKNNPNGPRHEIAHNSSVHNDEFSRYKSLNVTAEMSPAFLFTHPVAIHSGGTMDWNFTKMMDAGAHLTIGSDWGASPDPSLFEAMAGVVETVGKGSKEKGGELLCKMLTMNGAEAVGREKQAGSITVGKKANFIVMDKDLSKGEFAGAHVMRTYFEGECVWDKEMP